MSPITHALAGWVVANADSKNTPRERALIAFAGVAPDLDGLTIVAEWASRFTKSPVTWWSDYHHVFCHNIGFGIVLVGICAAFSKRRLATACWACLAFHLHLFCDILGSRGPGGEIWEVPYLLPFSRAGTIVWSGQWPLNGWPNFVVTAICVWLTFVFAAKRGCSPLEIISARADAAFVGALRKRFRKSHS